MSRYGDAFFVGVSNSGDGEVDGDTRRRMTRREREVEERMLARLVGDRGAREQLRVSFFSQFGLFLFSINQLYYFIS